MHFISLVPEVNNHISKYELNHFKHECELKLVWTWFEYADSECSFSKDSSNSNVIYCSATEFVFHLQQVYIYFFAMCFSPLRKRPTLFGGDEVALLEAGLRKLDLFLVNSSCPLCSASVNFNNQIFRRDWAVSLSAVWPLVQQHIIYLRPD